MTVVTVYDPAMCCSTGVCGPEVDPRLAQFAGDLNWLKGQGVKVQRFNLAQEPSAFVKHPEVKALLDRSGGEDLPAIVIGDVLVASGRYPNRAELSALAGVNTATASVEFTEQIKELVALGAAIGANCEPCFKFHYDKARKLGVSTDAMRQAVRVGEAVKAASARNIVGLADRMLAPSAPVGAPSSCCGAAEKPPRAEATTKKCC
ncbi:MAG: arsenite efflux transporter metallochaperone ArsD [Agrobacterium albertimagni]